MNHQPSSGPALAESELAFRAYIHTGMGGGVYASGPDPDEALRRAKREAVLSGSRADGRDYTIVPTGDDAVEHQITTGKTGDLDRETVDEIRVAVRDIRASLKSLFWQGMTVEPRVGETPAKIYPQEGDSLAQVAAEIHYGTERLVDLIAGNDPD